MSDVAVKKSGNLRGWVINILKIVIGLGIIAFIASKLQLDDLVVTADGKELRGRGLTVEGSLVFRSEAGEEQRVPLKEGPILERESVGEGKRFRVRLPRVKDPVPALEPRYVGELRFSSEGKDLRLPLETIQLKDVKSGSSEEGWIERVPNAAEGLYTIFGRLSLARYGLALLLMVIMYGTGIMRWHLLLRAQDLEVSLWQATRLTFIGFFFNNVVPGLTGGDLVKAVMIARRNKGRGTEAVTTVIVDRVVGIIVLALMSGVVLAATYPRYEEPTIAIFLFLCAMAGGVIFFFSRRVRRTLRIDQLLRRLPAAETLRRLDQAVLLYRRKPKVVAGAFGLSLLSHMATVGSVCLMGLDLGVDNSAGLMGTPIITYLATVPVILIASSVPLLPGGWGVGEFMYGFFFRAVGVRNLSLSVGLSVLTRVSMLLYSLLGGIFLLLERQETREALEAAKEEISDDAASAG